MKVESDRRGAVLDEAVLKCLKLKKKNQPLFLETIIDSQEVAKKHTEKSHALFPHLPQC